MNALAQISLYNNLFYVFLGIAVLGFAMSVFFFFYFDIPTVYAMMTGKAKKDTIRRMEEQNAKSGNLRLKTPEHSGRSGKTGARSKTAAAPVPPRREETSVLRTAAQETAILENESGKTVLLHGGDRSAPTPERLQPSRQEQGTFRFQVTETTVVIHTDEMI